MLSKLRCESHDIHKLKFSIEPFNKQKVNMDWVRKICKIVEAI